MKPESFDLPYAPFVSAIRAIGRVYLMAAAACVLLWAGLASANRWGPFDDGRGATTAVGPGVTGVVGGGIRLEVGGLSVQYPGEKDRLYAAQSYFDEAGRTEIVVTRFEVDEEGNRHSPVSSRVRGR